MEDMANLDWTALERLLPICLEFAEKKAQGERADLSDAANWIARAFGIDDLDALIADKLPAVLASGLNGAFGDDEAAAIAAVVASSGEPVMGLVVEFAQGGKDATKLVAGLNELCLSGTDELQNVLTKTLHVPESASDTLSSLFGPYLVSVYCLAATYKIYRKAADDAAMACERRIEAERLAHEAIERLQIQRSEMNELLSRYMLDRLLPFSQGASAMEQAILNDDDETFVQANAELWKLFGRKSQYNSVAEFDDLMMSDTTFKL